LIQQGYKRIAHVAGPLQFQIFNNRYRGYRDALRAYNMKEEEELVFVGDISIEKGKAAADYFLQLLHPPDAVFAVEDFTALGVMKRLKERHVRIPEETGVIGFANEDFGEHITPTLSSIDQQTVKMGREAFQLLYGIIGNGIQVDTEKIVLDPIPVFRESSLRNNHIV
jgi:LacI family transcriptional regulator